MLNIYNIHSSTLIKSPFKYSVIENVISHEYSKNLLNQLPNIGNYRSSRNRGSDKVYNVVNNILLELGQSSYNEQSRLEPIWIDLVQQLYGASYRKALSGLLAEDLTLCPMEITLKRYKYKDYISAHTDKEQVKATHLIFLNEEWDATWGGLLHFMDDNQKDIATFLPTCESSVAFVRSDVSWHRASPVLSPDKERIALQVAFWNRIDRTVAPGRHIQLED